MLAHVAPGYDREMTTRLLALAALASAGCRQLLGFEDVAAGDGGLLPDAGPCASLVTECANPDVLRTCVGVGELPVDTPCDWGCVDTGNAHCGQLAPAGGAVTPEDADEAELSMLGEVTLVGSLSTDEGKLNGAPILNAEFHVVGNVGILRAKSVSIAGNLKLIGTHALAIVASSISIDGVLDAQGTCNGNTAGPGGFAGGAVGQAGGGPGGGGGGLLTNGGGGGGHGGRGGNGGNTTANVVAGGVSYGDAAISTLVGGSGGGGGAVDQNNVGGGGGGAIQLVSSGSISMSANGGINAGGCGPERTNCPQCTSGGGGAGGAILLEAFSISIDGVIAVNGGGGAGSGSAGEDGLLSRIPAKGGGVGNGGPGGDGAAGPTIDGASAPASGQRPGGGGGAVGRIRFGTRSGNVTFGGSVLSPDVTDLTTATVGPAAIR